MKLTNRILFSILIMISLLSCSPSKIKWEPASETNHFIFFITEGSKNAIPSLANELEANYTRITQDLQVTPTVKFSVYIFEDVDTFHKTDGRPDASPSSVGTTHGIDIWLVSPLNPGDALNTQEALTAGVHEFTHALVNYINGSLKENNYQIPIWLNEGLAGYEAGQMSADWRARLAQLIADGAIPSINTDLVPDRFAEVKGLPFSITLVEYIIQQYGIEKVVDIIKSPTEVELILGITLPELDSNWREYLQKEYLTKCLIHLAANAHR